MPTFLAPRRRLSGAPSAKAAAWMANQQAAFAAAMGRAAPPPPPAPAGTTTFGVSPTPAAASPAASVTSPSNTGGFFGSPAAASPAPSGGGTFGVAQPATPTPTACGTDWTSATAEVNAVSSAVRACQGGSLPALIAACPSGSDGGTGSYSDYLAARAAYGQAVQDAAALCAATGAPAAAQPDPYYNQGSYGGFSSDPYAPAAQTPAPTTPLIAPDPGMSRRGKIAIGAGGSLVLLGLVFVMMRGRKHRLA